MCIFQMSLMQKNLEKPLQEKKDIIEFKQI